MSTLDKEFRALLQAKIDEAGKLLKEVNDALVDKGINEELIDLTQDYGEYYNEDDESGEDETTLSIYSVISALSNGGWSTSSMSC